MLHGYTVQVSLATLIHPGSVFPTYLKVDEQSITRRVHKAICGIVETLAQIGYPLISFESAFVHVIYWVAAGICSWERIADKLRKKSKCFHA